MSNNPFAGWTEARVREHNARVAKGKLKICHDIAGSNHIYVDAEELKLLTKTSEHYPQPLKPSDLEDLFKTEKHRKYSIPPFVNDTPVFNAARFERKIVSLPGIKLIAIGAVRMTRSDKSLRRPCVRAYMEFRNKLVELAGKHPAPDKLNFRCWIPMPASWSKKKKREMDGQPHKQKPDLDNACKVFMDSLFDQDKGVWGTEYQEKFWCREGKERIDIELVYLIPRNNSLP